MTLDEILNGETQPAPDSRLMSYGPIEGEYHHAAMYGPQGNALGPDDVAASPDTGHQLGDLVDVGDGRFRRVSDWSYYHPGQPTHNTYELRDRHDMGRGPVKSVSLNDILGPAQDKAKPVTDQNPDSQLESILHRHVQEGLRTGAIEPGAVDAAMMQGYEPNALGSRTGAAVRRGDLDLETAMAQTARGYGHDSPEAPQPGALEGFAAALPAINEAAKTPSPEWLRKGEEAFQRPLYNPEHLLAGKDIDQSTGEPMGKLDAALSNMGRGALSFMSSPKGVLESVLPELFIAEGIAGTKPAIDAIKAAEQTAPFSQERYEAAGNVLMTLGAFKGGHSAFEHEAAGRGFQSNLEKAMSEQQAPKPPAPPVGTPPVVPPNLARAENMRQALPEELPQGRVSPETGFVHSDQQAAPVTGETARFRDPNSIYEEDARGNSRAVSESEFRDLQKSGQRMLDEKARRGSPADAIAQNIDDLAATAHEQAQKPWGGITVDSHTGEIVTPDEGYSVTVKAPGQKTISLPIDAGLPEIKAAIAKATETFKAQLDSHGGHLGVFRDDAVGRIDIDPVQIVKTPAEVEAIGAHTRAIGGAYDYKTGDGYFPPHIKDGLAARPQTAQARGTQLNKAYTEPRMEGAAPTYDKPSRPELERVAAERAAGGEGQRIVQEIQKNPRPLQQGEAATLRTHISSLEAEKGQAVSDANSGNPEAAQRLRDLQVHLQDAYAAAHRAGSEWGSTGNEYQQIAPEFSSPEQLKAEVKATQNGKELSQEQSKTVDKLFNDIKSSKEAREAALRPEGAFEPKSPKEAMSKLKQEAAKAMKRLSVICE